MGMATENIDTKLRGLLLKVRKGAWSGLNPKNWKMSLEALGYEVAFEGTGSLRQIFVTAPDGSTVQDRARGPYKMWSWLKERNLADTASKFLGLPTASEEASEREGKKRDWTNTGTCPCCGMNVKLRKGRIVLHGYKRPGWGAVEGECFGVSYLPYEKGTQGCEAYKKALEAQLKSSKVYLSRLSSPSFSEPLSDWGRKVESVQKDDPRWALLLDDKKREVQRGVKATQAEISRMESLIEAWKPGLPMPEQIAREKGWL